MNWFDLLNIGGNGDDPLDLQNLPETSSANTPRSSLYGDDAYGTGMTGGQTSRYDTILNLTGSKDLANIAASGDTSSLLKNVGGAAKNFLTSPGGVATLGAILGAANRPQPTGGGTTMAYPGAAKLERKMVQGPYGPLAEYTGVGGGAPDYTPFTAPTFGAPDVGGRAPTTPAPSPGAGMSVQSKVDLYKQLAGYGLGADRIRRIAETFYGPQTDTDWAELTRLAGVGTGIAAPAPKPGGAPVDAGKSAKLPDPTGGPTTGALTGPPKTLVTDPAQMLNEYTSLRGFSETVGAGGSLSPESAYRQLEFKFGPLSATQKKSLEDAYQRNLAKPTGIGQQVRDYSPEAKAATYENYLARGLTDKEIRAMAEKQFGPIPESDWAELQRIAKTLPDDLLPKAGKVPTDIQTEAAVLKNKLPTDWNSYSPKQKSDWFNSNNATPAMLKSQGVTDAEIDALRQYGYKFAHGGTVQMEDGGFVLTKRAVDGAGGPRGIAQLVPGARLIRGPGTGTSDSIPATIQGRHGQTPAKVSNGEAYVPKRFVQAQGGPQRMYALMNKLQRKA